MSLSWNEIRNRALAFSKEWAGEAAEKAEAQTFWNAFFDIFGVNRRRVATFEKHIKKIDNKDGYIDLLWKGVLMIEHKSLGGNLNKAYTQAKDYFPNLSDKDLPRYIIVSDFNTFCLYDLDDDKQHQFTLSEFHKNIKLFGFIAGYQTRTLKEQDPVNIKAAQCMGRLHDRMNEIGYSGHELEVYLVRLLFCLFAEDTGIFQRRQFQDYIEQRTAEDGSDLGANLSAFFHVLNTAENKRLKILDEHLKEFPYINGNLFAENLLPAAFDKAMRQALLDCCALDWSRISPAIFGALFQSIMDKAARRSLGAHYTSEKNILKLINPLFMDELRAEFNKVKNNKNRLFEFHKKLRLLKFLDPACGCGNFLIIAYRELRLLELNILKAAKKNDQGVLNIHQMIQLDVNQFSGIEIEEFPAQIARTAMWLIDHQMNLLVSETFGMYYARIPLKASANIIHGNALIHDWNENIPAEQLSYIMGNPPFVGAKLMNAQQRHETAAVFTGIKNAGLLDFVAAWYVKAAHYIKQNTAIQCAYVSTNSITIGEQVAVLWDWLLAKGIKINFAHRTFSWSSEAKGKAAVHCVIIGFGLQTTNNKRLYEYENIKGEAQEIKAKNINPYLVDTADIFLFNRSSPICDSPNIGMGNKPIDNGNYLFTPEEKKEFLIKEPQAKKYFRRWLGATEFINSYERWCLWLGECPPNELRQMPESCKRIEAVNKFRLASKSAPTRKLANTPTRFHLENMPKGNYLIVPKVSSEKRFYIPMGFETPKILCGDAAFIISNVSLYDFGVLTSLMHNAWMRAVCGRLKSDYRYSAGIVYNNFPWAFKPSEKQKADIAQKAQAIINTRKQYPEATLADLYDPLTMPQPLLKAHQTLDKAVDKTYRKTAFASEAERVAHLFTLHQQHTSQLHQPKRKGKK